MNLKDAYLHGTDQGALVKNISWSNGKLVIKWAQEGKADTTLDTPVSGANITLSTSAQNFLTANNTTYTIKLPSTDPYQSDNDDRYVGKFSYTLSAQSGVRISFTQHNPVLISVCGSNSGAQLVLVGTGYGAGGRVRNQFTELVSCTLFDWCVPNSDSISCSVEILSRRDGDSTVYVQTTGDITFTAINALTSARENATLYHTGNLSPMTTSHPANDITSTNISNWNSAYNWYNLTVATESDTDAVINKWKEVTDFLNGITDTETLTSLLAGRVAKSGDTMTGALTTPGLTVTGAATFSQAINGSILGNAATASRLQNARTISLGGHASGSATFDGSSNVTLSVSGVYATTAAINNSDADSTYRLVWHSGNTLYSTGDIYVNPSTDVIYSKGLQSSGNVGVTGTIIINPGSASNWCEGIRIKPASNGWTTLIMGSSADSGTGTGAWSFHTSNNNFYLNYAASDTAKAQRLWGHANGYTIGNTSTTTYNLNVAGDIWSGGYVRATSGFIKGSSSNDYVLLGGGGHKPISEFTTLSGEQTVTGNKTFSGSVTVDDLTAGNLVITGGASFAQTINGNAATASKLATARTIALTGSVTGSGTFDGSGNLSIATTTNHTHDYLPLAGGTMTGAAPINFTPNTVQMNFRPGHDGFNAKLEYMTNGNEALVFATKNAVTSFMFVNGLDLTDRSDYAAIGATTTNKIAMQIKSNKVTINKAIRGDSDSQTAALDVGGTVLSEKLGYSGLIYNTDYRFIHDSASFIKQNSSTGTICIKLPLLFNSTNGQYDMPVIKLVIYEYSTQGASEIIIGGHNWNGSWYNCTYTVTGNYNKGVRLGRLTDGDKNYCILLGTTDTTWSYVAIYVTDTFTQYSNDWIANWINACTVSQITDESNIAGIVDPGYGIGGKYLPLAGGTMTGLITTSSGANHRGVKVGNTYINAINGELIFQNNSSIRFGGDSWDYDIWAGLKYVHSSKTVYLGLADNSAFTANTAQTDGKLYTPGISNIYIGNGTYTVYHSGNVNTTTVPWTAEYLQLKNVTNDWNITLNENKLRFISCVGTTATGAPGAYYSGLSVMTGYVGFQLCTYGGATPDLKFRKLQDNGTWHGWYDILHSGNYTDYLYNQSTSDARFVLKAGDTMTGALTVPSLSVTGASTFSQAINGSILGNAATASRLQNARTISLTGNVTGSASFDGSGNISISTTVSGGTASNADTVDNEHASAFAHREATNNFVHSSNEITMVGSGYSGELYYNYRTTGGTNGNIKEYNFCNGAGTVLGSISNGQFSGNAASATKLAASKTIWGQSFDGSSNIDGTLQLLNSYISINADTYGSSCPNRVNINAGLPFGSAYTSSGMRLYSNGLGIRDPYCGVTYGSGSNDSLWIRMVEETANQGWAEIATGDDGTEPIYIRQYGTSSTVINSVTILDDSGNTSFPKTVTVGVDLIANGDGRFKGNDLYIGSASGSQCHQQYDTTNKCLKFYFD